VARSVITERASFRRLDDLGLPVRARRLSTCAIMVQRSSGRRGALTVLSIAAVAIAYGCARSEADGFSDDTLTGEPSGFAPGGELPSSSSGKPAGPACGNSVKDPNETCDDGNPASADGCSSTCHVEPGWKCVTVGAACVAAACGDGIVAGDEDCDDGNITAKDGCSPTCVFEPGFKCPVPGKPCVPTVCGDGKKEGTEQCDDGNVRPYDGCSVDCTIEPKCSGGTCTGVCGDALKFPGEACDDGNARPGDGCSATCTLEAGFNCQVLTSDLPPTIDVPVIYRDFTPATHPDFESFIGGVVKGMVNPALGVDGAPVLLSVGSPQMISSAASFHAWYHDTGVSQVLISKLTLARNPIDDSYVFDSNSFFPIDGLGFGNYAASGHNFHFTSELRYTFVYKGGEVLDFRGDDDIFVFVNGKLAVDIGGVHDPAVGSVTLDAAGAATYGLTVGGMYELDVFQAERHMVGSNYKLTLRGFAKAKTVCTPICGDGIKTKSEACDDGKNLGGYGACAPGCVLGPRCGDGIVQADHAEQCDDGNLVSGDGCSATCILEASVPK
jgi:fibro-slime domain-containing protein